MRQAQLRVVLGYLHRVANPNSGEPDDVQLLERWRTQHDPAAFEVLVWRHGALVWNLCRRVLAREQDIEDAFQATWLTFLRKADTIGQGRFLGTWLYKVAYRIALAARAASVRHTVREALDADFPEAAAADGWEELGPVLDEEVNRLPDKYRRPFVLCYLEGKTTDEAARDLGCPRGTVGTRLAWARERLRARLTRRGVVLSAAGLATLLAEKAAGASLPATVVLCTVKTATLSAAGKLLVSGVISARVAALTQGALQAMFMTKLKTITLVLLAVGILGSGAGLLAQRVAGLVPAGSNPAARETTQTADVKQPPAQREEGVFPNENTPVAADEASLFFAEEDKPSTAKDKAPPAKDKTPPAKDKGKESDSRQLFGKVARVDRDGKGLGLKLPSKEGEGRTVDIKFTDKTQLVFNGVGPNEAKLAEGYAAFVRLEKDSKDVAAQVHLIGYRNIAGSILNDKSALPQLTLPVIAVAGDGKGITLEVSGKGEQPSEKIAVQFTDKTRLFFSNVARNGAKATVGYVARVWLDEKSRDSAKVVLFVGKAEGKPAERKPADGKGPKVDQSGRITGVSGDGKILTVEVPAAEKGDTMKIEIKITDATKESFHGVMADGAKPTEGYQVEVWLAEGSKDSAAGVQYHRSDSRKSLNARILSVTEDGSRLTVETPPQGKGGEATRKEIKITAKTRVVFFNVGPGGAKPNEGYHVGGWLVEGSEDTADELILSAPKKSTEEKPGDKKPIDKKPADKKVDDKKEK